METPGSSNEQREADKSTPLSPEEQEQKEQEFAKSKKEQEKADIGQMMIDFMKLSDEEYSKMYQRKGVETTSSVGNPAAMASLFQNSLDYVLIKAQDLAKEEPDTELESAKEEQNNQKFKQLVTPSQTAAYGKMKTLVINYIRENGKDRTFEPKRETQEEKRREKEYAAKVGNEAYFKRVTLTYQAMDLVEEIKKNESIGNDVNLLDEDGNEITYDVNAIVDATQESSLGLTSASIAAGIDNQEREIISNQDGVILSQSNNIIGSLEGLEQAFKEVRKESEKES